MSPGSPPIKGTHHARCPSLRAYSPSLSVLACPLPHSLRSLRPRLTAHSLRDVRSPAFAIAHRDHPFGGSLGRSSLRDVALSLTVCGAQASRRRAAAPPGHGLAATSWHHALAHTQQRGVRYPTVPLRPLARPHCGPPPRWSYPDLGGRFGPHALYALLTSGKARPDPLSRVLERRSTMRCATPKRGVCRTPQSNAALRGLDRPPRWGRLGA